MEIIGGQNTLPVRQYDCMGMTEKCFGRDVDGSPGIYT